ncbi:MAG: hypothetical protein MZV63_25300 [Marinilabiliales bacterium]|nr:hypothetical protein [Marinilabiliales bacterium]
MPSPRGGQDMDSLVRNIFIKQFSEKQCYEKVSISICSILCSEQLSQKSDLQVNPQLNLLDELTGISMLDFSGLIQKYGAQCLKINPYSYVGDIVEESFFEFDKLLQSGKGEVEVKSSEIVKIIKSKATP